MKSQKTCMQKVLMASLLEFPVALNDLVSTNLGNHILTLSIGLCPRLSMWPLGLRKPWPLEWPI